MIEYGFEKYAYVFEEYKKEIADIAEKIEKDKAQLKNTSSEDFYNRICDEDVVEHLQKCKDILSNYIDNIFKVSAMFSEVENDIADQFKI